MSSCLRANPLNSINIKIKSKTVTLNVVQPGGGMEKVKKVKKSQQGRQSDDAV